VLWLSSLWRIMCWHRPDILFLYLSSLVDNLVNVRVVMIVFVDEVDCNRCRWQCVHCTLLHCAVLSGFMLTATVSAWRELYDSDRQKREVYVKVNVSLVFERQTVVSSTCSECCGRVWWCEHIIAAILYRIKHANDVSTRPITSQVHRGP